MDPDKIELNNLAKSFEYIKIASEIDECDDRDVLRNIAKSFCKLYYKQQETLSVIGIPTNQNVTFDVAKPLCRKFEHLWWGDF